MANDKERSWKDWPKVPPGQLKHEIEKEFEGAQAGEYCALLVKVENPITGYSVVKRPA
jgi:hypothetical protein